MAKGLAIAMLLALAGCTESTRYGACVGAFDERDPTKVYKLNGWNLAMGLIFFEMIVPPILVVVDEAWCPIADRHSAPELKHAD